VATVTVKSIERLRQLVITDRQAIVSDEPPEAGDGLGPDPYQLLLAALGSCTAMTLRMYADRKGWPLGDVTVELSHEHVHAKDCAECALREDAWLDVIRRYILIPGPLDEEQKARLRMVADRCPVHRTLHGTMRVLTEMDVAG